MLMETKFKFQWNSNGKFQGNTKGNPLEIRLIFHWNTNRIWNFSEMPIQWKSSWIYNEIPMDKNLKTSWNFIEISIKYQWKSIESHWNLNEIPDEISMKYQLKFKQIQMEIHFKSSRHFNEMPMEFWINWK